MSDAKKATVEIGHTYSPNRLVKLTSDKDAADFYDSASSLSFLDTPEAASARSIAESFGADVIRVALIDDVLVQDSLRKTSDVARTLLFKGVGEAGVRLGTGVEQKDLYHESDFEEIGRQLVATIQAMDLPNGYRLSQNGDKLKIGSGKNMHTVRLQGYDGIDDPTYPSCEILDLAWLQKRLTLAPRAITVLPESYAAQQERVDILADLIGIDPSSHETVMLQ